MGVGKRPGGREGGPSEGHPSHTPLLPPDPAKEGEGQVCRRKQIKQAGWGSGGGWGRGREEKVR